LKECLSRLTTACRKALPKQTEFAKYIIFMVDSSQPCCPKFLTGLWAFSIPVQQTIRNPPMMKVTAKPAWQWSSNATPSTLRMPSSFARAPSPLRNALLPRSLDMSFSLRYRR